MSTTQQTVSVPADSTDLSDSVLLAFAESIREKLATFKVTPEQAVKSKSVKPMLIKAYLTAKEKQAADEAAQIDAGVIAMLEADFLGITPEMKKAKREKDWTTDFSRDQTKQVPAPNLDAEKNHRCGMAEIVGCCDGKTQVHAFAFTDWSQEVYYGLCQSMVLAFQAVTSALGKNPRLHYMNLDKANGRVQEAKRRKLDAEKDAPIVAWVYDFGNGKAENLPEARKSLIEGKHFCGLPTNCCSHEEPVRSYHAHDGVVYGLCERGHDAYWQYVKDTNRKAMKPMRSLSEATSAAANQVEVKPLHNWVDRFVSTETVGTGDDDPGEEPVVVRSKEEQFLICGLPPSIGCCDHSEPAVGFPSIGGMVYGICKKAAWAYCEGRIRHSDPECLMYAKDIEVAEKIAADWRQRNVGNDDAPEEPGSDGNNTKARRRARLAKKQARSAANLANKPKPNSGSGPIEQMGYANPGGGKKK